MSGFFGVFSPGGNVDRLVFDQMQQAIQRDGYEELETHVDDRIAMGHLMLRVTQESTYDKQPLNSSCGQYLLVGHFRLDYRDELGDKLGLTQKELDVTPDSLLAMMAYQKWKDKCVHHIEGDWAFVLYDNLDNSLICFKDKYGTSALFYVIHQGKFIFSYSTQLFQNLHSFSLTIDMQQMFRLNFVGLGFENEKTLIKGIRSLSGGVLMYMDAALSQVQSIYFDFHFPNKIFYKSEFDYVLDFRSKLMLAVLTRIRNIKEIGIFQSSGLDSNSILYFAANETVYRNRILFSYTACNAHLNQFNSRIHRFISDEILLKIQLTQYSNVHSNFDDFKSVDFESLFEEISNDFYQPLMTKNSYWIKGIFQNSKSDKVGLLLNGQLGNFTISWNAPNFFVTQLLNFKIKHVLSQLTNIVRFSKYGILKFTWHQIIKPIFGFLTNLVLYFFKVYPAKKGDIIFKDKYIQSIDWEREIVSPQFKIGLSNILDSNKLRFSLLRANAMVSGERWYCESSRRAVLTSDPTVDFYLLQFIMSIPSYLFFNKGVQKYIIRKSMNKRLCSDILSNSYPVLQSYDIGKRIVKSSFIENYIKKISNNTLLDSVFDIEKLKEKFLQIRQCKDDSLQFQISMIFLKELSIVYLYEKYHCTNNKSNEDR